MDYQQQEGNIQTQSPVTYEPLLENEHVSPHHQAPQPTYDQSTYQQPTSPGLAPSSQLVPSSSHVAIPVLNGTMMLRGKHYGRVAASRQETSTQLENLRQQKQGDEVVQTIFPHEERVMPPINIRRIANVDPKTGEVLTDSTVQACLEITRHRILFASGYVVPGINEQNVKAQGSYDLVTDVATITCTHEQKFTAWNLPLSHVLNVELDTSLGIKSVKTVWAKRRVWVAVLTVVFMLLEFGVAMLISERDTGSIIGASIGSVFIGFIGFLIYYFWTGFHEVPAATSSVEQKVLSISCISPTTFQPTITKIEFCFNTTNSNDLIKALNHISPKPGRAPVICSGTVTQIKVDPADTHTTLS
eukprot:TRINITY_DN28769_c0_g1_i1.p1 TRINITY_DN28769_c0_g1~~TRINITY_DN28769_c0_g1_i1.p1  ORF type:complete len:359 (+),score=60.76 TRINITY_DN28769_c0_g1_i1:52-1128(+)